MLSGKLVIDEPIHLFWIFASSPLALILSMKAFSAALISFSPRREHGPL